MSSDAQNRGGFPDAKEAYDKTYAQFNDEYTGKIIGALRGSWDSEKMSKKYGYPEKPSDAQFKKWAEELIHTRQITYTDADGKEAVPITLPMFQSQLPDNVKNDLRTTFGTDDLNYIILDKEQFPTAGQQLGQASFNQLSGFAKILNVIMGALDWLVDKLQGGNMGFQEAVARRTTQSMADNAAQMLGENAPSIHPGMRRYLVRQYKNAIDQEAGLIAPTQQIRPEDIPLGSNLPKPAKTEAPAPGPANPAAGANTGAANASPAAGVQPPQMNLTGTPEERVKQVITGISDQMMEQMLKDKGHEALTAAEALRPAMIDIGTTVVMNNKQLLESGDSQKLAEIYANALLENADVSDKLKAMARSSPELKGVKEEHLPRIISATISEDIEPLLNNSTNRGYLLAAMNGQNAPAPTAPAVPATAATAPPATAAPSTPATSSALSMRKVQVATEAMVASITTDKTKEFVISEAVKGYNDSWVGYGYGPIKNELKLINRLDGKPLSETDRVALDEAKNKVYKFAIDNGYAPNAHEGGQQSVISKAVGEAVAETISDPEYRGLSREALAKRIEIAVANKLQENHGEINKRGRPIEEINGNAGLNVFASIAKQVGAEVRNPNGKTYGQLIEAQNRIAQAQLAGIDRNGLTNLATHTTPGAMVAGEQGGPRHTSSPAPVSSTQPRLGS